MECCAGVLLENRAMLTDVMHEIVFSDVAVVVRVRWRKNMRWSLDEHNVSAFHHMLCDEVVDPVGLAFGAVPTQRSLPRLVRHFLRVRLHVHEGPSSYDTKMREIRLCA